VYIYLSNQSNNDVYWDNFAAGITQGNIAEENHYYAYGLKVTTLSSKKLGDSYEGSLKNNYLYQGAFAELDDDIGWTDFALRNYDAQIGRWVQQDPYQQFASPYVGMGDDPVNLTDPSGGVVIDPTMLGEVIVTAVRHSSKVFTAATNLEKLVKAVNFSVKIANIINSSVNTRQSGNQAGDIHFTPGGQAMYFPDDSPEFFKGESVKVGGLSIQPMSGSVHAFTITGEHARGGAVRFVAMFDKASGRFTGYSWDKKLSYTYDDFIKDAEEDYLTNAEHEGDPMWDSDVSEEQAAKNTLNLGLTVVIPNVILKTGTTVANAANTSKSVGFEIKGQLVEIFGNKKFFSNWIKGNASLSRITKPLNSIEAQQIITNAKRLGLHIESNINGLKGLEVTGQWKGIPHFKVGNVHIPIEKGIDGVLKF
jgi:RHS repeat-associated protein